MTTNMTTNMRPRKKEKDLIAQAFLKRMREIGKGFFIFCAGPWIHPANKVKNCYAVLLDGFVIYKFELTLYRNNIVFKVKLVNGNHNWFRLKDDFRVGEKYTYEELLNKIKCN